MSVYNLHFSESLWGPDVHEFNPDRWLGQTDDNLDQCLAPFSKGTVLHWAKVRMFPAWFS
jgi:cytochrome P450